MNDVPPRAHSAGIPSCEDDNCLLPTWIVYCRLSLVSRVHWLGFPWLRWARSFKCIYFFLLLLLGYCQTIDLRIPGTRIMSWMYISNYFWNKKLLCRFLDMWYMLTIRKREKCVAWDWTLASPSYFTRYSLLISFWRWSYSVLSIFSSLWIINTIVKNMHHDHM